MIDEHWVQAHAEDLDRSGWPHCRRCGGTLFLGDAPDRFWPYHDETGYHTDETECHMTNIAKTVTDRSSEQLEKIDQDAVRRTHDALTDVIRSVLSSDDRHRYMTVSRLCKVGIELNRAAAVDVSAFTEGEQAQIMDMDAPRFGGIRMGGGGNDIHGLSREMLLQIGPVLQQWAESQQSHLAEDRAGELNRLMLAREKATETERAAIQQRIDILTASLNDAPTTVPTDKEEQNEVVHPELPRGHHTGAHRIGGGQANGGGHPAADGERGEGAHGVAEDCGRAQMVQAPRLPQGGQSGVSGEWRTAGVPDGTD